MGHPMALAKSICNPSDPTNEMSHHQRDSVGSVPKKGTPKKGMRFIVFFFQMAVMEKLLGSPYFETPKYHMVGSISVNGRKILQKNDRYSYDTLSTSHCFVFKIMLNHHFASYLMLFILYYCYLSSYIPFSNPIHKMFVSNKLSTDC